MPFQPALVAIDAELEIAFSLPGATWLTRACPRAPPSKRSMTWALSSTWRPSTKDCKSAQALEREAGHEAGQVEGMGADVADRAAQAPTAGSVRQSGLLVVLFLDRQPVLRIFDLHHPDPAELAAFAPSRAPGGSSDSRCNCGSARTARRRLPPPWPASSHRPASRSAACRRSRGCRASGIRLAAG
jgi:hypothetical protein